MFVLMQSLVGRACPHVARLLLITWTQRNVRYASGQFQPSHLTCVFQPPASREAQSIAVMLSGKVIPADDAIYNRRSLPGFPRRQGLRQ